MTSFFITSLFCVAVVQAVPTLFTRQSITSLTRSQIDAFDPFTHYASAAYCPASTTLPWNCGANCDGNPNFIPVASGGDGTATQYWYVGYDPNLKTVIVAHQGTNPSHFLPLLTDIKALRDPLDAALFPGLPSTIGVHKGFRKEHARTAQTILSAVQSTMSKYKTTSVTTVGHSLGAALSLLESVYLGLHLPSGTSIRAVLYGLPRVGNKAWADYVDSTNIQVTHINNQKDPIPTVPPAMLGYEHPSGEVHITEDSSWKSCPGHDNPDKQCMAGDVPTVFSYTLANHDGPYNGITIGC